MTTATLPTGRDKPVCEAKTRSGGHCQRPAGWGTSHAGVGRCKLHGGATPNHQKAANAEKARAAVAAFALPVKTTHEDALVDNLGRWTGIVIYCAGRIAEFESDDELTQTSIGAGRERYERPSVLVEMYQTALREQLKAAKVCADVGIDERRTKLAEHQGQLLDGVLRALIAGLLARLPGLGLAPEAVIAFERDEVPAIVRAAVFAVVPPEQLNGGA